MALLLITAYLIKIGNPANCFASQGVCNTTPSLIGDDITCTAGSTCTAYCDQGLNDCNSITCEDNSICDVNCNSKSACFATKFYCNNNSICNINCKHTDASVCESSNFYADNAKQLTISTIGTSAAKNAYVYCPHDAPGGAVSCILQSFDNSTASQYSGVHIYAIEGFNDVSITCYANNCAESGGITLHCGILENNDCPVDTTNDGKYTKCQSTYPTYCETFLLPTYEPTTAVPTTSVPTTYEPTTINPTTFIPTTSTPTTNIPTTSNPTTSIPTTHVPTTQFPTAFNPTTSNPTTFNPTIHPTTSNPTTFNPTSITTVNPTINPSDIPTYYPTDIPSNIPTYNPSISPNINSISTTINPIKHSNSIWKEDAMLFTVIIGSIAVLMAIIIIILICCIKRKKRKDKNTHKQIEMGLSEPTNQINEAINSKANEKKLHIENGNKSDSDELYNYNSDDNQTDGDVLSGDTNAGSILKNENGELQLEQLSNNTGFYVKAILNYNACDEDQLDLKTENIVYIVKKLESGWWYGYKMAENNKHGWIPSNYVKRCSISEQNKLALDQNKKRETNVSDLIVDQLENYLANVEKYTNIMLPPKVLPVVHRNFVTNDESSSDSDGEIETYGNTTMGTVGHV